ncbi:MAG: App1 family protein [Chthoniobacterales bacterium]
MRASLYLTLALLSSSCASYRGTCPDVESFRPLRGHGVTVISDIDDTIKDTHVKLGRTHIPNPAIIFDGLHSWHRVNDMARLYKEKWSSLRATTIIYVSAGPCCYEPRLKRSIKKWEFPMGPIVLRKGGPFPPAPHDYKTRAIYPIINNSRAHHFVLIGDSGESDPECYGDLAREFPREIDAIYIRNISDDPGARYKWAFRDIPEKKIHYLPDDLRDRPR